MTDPATNQRRFSRVPFAASVHLLGSGGSTVVQLLDISLKGALVSRPADWSVDAGTALALELILVDNVYIRANVKVAHSAANRVGLFWEQIDLDSMTHLRRRVQLNLGDAALLDRELAAMG